MKLLTFPNVITMTRLALMPLFLVCFYATIFPNHQLWALAFFALAALTDWLDGMLARMLGQTSKFGEFIDPVVDKIIVCMGLVVIVETCAAWYVTLPALVIISREITVSALREWMAEFGQRAHVQVSLLGKCKTAVQLAAILLLLIAPGDGHALSTWLGLALLYVATALTLLSMYRYLQAAYRAQMM